LQHPVSESTIKPKWRQVGHPDGSDVGIGVSVGVDVGVGVGVGVSVGVQAGVGVQGGGGVGAQLEAGPGSISKATIVTTIKTKSTTANFLISPPLLCYLSSFNGEKPELVGEFNIRMVLSYF
jgi:hypothetical protein